MNEIDSYVYSEYDVLHLAEGSEPSLTGATSCYQSNVLYYYEDSILYTYSSPSDLDYQAACSSKSTPPHVDAHWQQFEGTYPPYQTTVLSSYEDPASQVDHLVPVAPPSSLAGALGWVTPRLPKAPDIGERIKNRYDLSENVASGSSSSGKGKSSACRGTEDTSPIHDHPREHEHEELLERAFNEDLQAELGSATIDERHMPIDYSEQRDGPSPGSEVSTDSRNMSLLAPESDPQVADTVTPYEIQAGLTYLTIEDSPSSSSPSLEVSRERAKRRIVRRCSTIACYFCRRRKIACGGPMQGRPDKTCGQCARRHQVCEWPEQSYRGCHLRDRSGNRAKDEA